MTEGKRIDNDKGELRNQEDVIPASSGQNGSIIPTPPPAEPSEDFYKLEIFKAAIAYHTILHNEISRYRTVLFSALVLSFSIPLAISSRKIEFCYVSTLLNRLIFLVFILWLVGVGLIVYGMRKSLLFKKWEPKKRKEERNLGLDLCRGDLESAIANMMTLFQTDYMILINNDTSRRLYAFAIFLFIISVIIIFSIYIYGIGGFYLI